MNSPSGIQLGGSRIRVRVATSHKTAEPIKISKAVIEITVRITAAPTRQSSTASRLTGGADILMNHDTARDRSFWSRNV